MSSKLRFLSPFCVGVFAVLAFMLVIADNGSVSLGILNLICGVINICFAWDNWIEWKADRIVRKMEKEIEIEKNIRSFEF